MCLGALNFRDLLSGVLGLINYNSCKGSGGGFRVEDWAFRNLQSGAFYCLAVGCIGVYPQAPK